MDSITHIALGACMGEAFAGKQLGKKAMLWGAMAQSIPDVDFLASFWMNTSSNLLAHRGFTHSILFCLIITPLLALIANYWHRPHNIKLSKWIYFFGGVIFAHIFIDAFNNYGVGWFEPFNHTRISFNIIYVADPFFSIFPGIALVALIILRSRTPKRKFWWKLGLGISSLYLVYCSINKAKINSDVQQILKNKNIPYTKYITTPAPFQNWLWYIVASNDSGKYVGFRSLFDSKKEINFSYFPSNTYLLQNINDHEELQKLIRFSQQFYTVEKWHDTIVFNDLRFGQIIGWENTKGKFVFHYYLEHPNQNKLVVQRGRFEGWNWKIVKGFLERIKGE